MSTELSSEYGVNACSEVSSEHFEIFDGKSKVEVDGVSKSGSVSRDVMQMNLSYKYTMQHKCDKLQCYSTQRPHFKVTM